ncbi:hypothetical protein L9F63_015518 [Diploptera punctata]|uniref:Uncharacterized protein n=1 Tax=Diploptera punctata TaxID=6984 RepID=A0AAD8EKF5_DIPPU|nr:hypothetical protein L9F63_015518 [Diploptera punctata]
MSLKNSECEDEWSEIQQRFEKEGLDYENLCVEERLLHVWRWLVDAESNLRTSRRQLDKLRDLRSEEMEEMESYIGHIRDLAEKRAGHLESETMSLRTKLESSQQQTATLATLLEKSGLHCIAEESLGEQVAFLIADRAKLMEEIDILKKLKISNGVNGLSKEGDLLSEIIKKKKFCVEKFAEMCDRVQLLEKASRQLELDNERLAFKLSEALAELEERESQLKHLGLCDIELESVHPEKPDCQEDTGTQTETEVEDNKEIELHKSFSFGDRDIDAKSHSLGADSTPPSLLLSGFSSPKKLSSLLDSQIAASRSELVRLEETKKLQSECENLKGQLTALSEKYNALAMRHIQYKSKRKAQVEDLRNRLDVELSSLQCQVENLQSQLAVQRKMLTTEENFRERIEADYRQLQEEKRTMLVNVMHLEATLREKDRELSVLAKKIALLENANSDLLAKVLQLKYASGRHHAKHVGAVPKSNSIEGVLTDLGRV